jgi:hypothetical protein
VLQDKSLRQMLIDTGVLRPRPSPEHGEPTTSDWRDVPTLRIDAHGARAAEPRRDEPVQERRRPEDKES